MSKLPASAPASRKGFHRGRPTRTGHQPHFDYGLCHDVTRACNAFFQERHIPAPQFNPSPPPPRQP